MSVSVQFNGSTFLSSKEASRVFGYSSDYIARLARQEKITATRIGHQWFVEPTSLGKFLVDSSEETSSRLKKMSVERKLERSSFQETATVSVAQTFENSVQNISQNSHAHAVSAFAIFTGFLIACVPYISVPSNANFNQNFISFYSTLEQTAFGLHQGFNQGLSISEIGNSEASIVTGGIVAANANDNDVNEIAQHSQNSHASHGDESGYSSGRLNGLVVFPDTLSASRTIEKIEKSFSDKVIVSEDKNNPHTGTIVPVFRDEKSSEEFRYVIVPVQDPP